MKLTEFLLMLSFSPIKRVNHTVDTIRVGKELDHESLVLEIETNGTVNPEDAMQSAVKIFVDHMQMFSRINEEPEQDSSDEDVFEDMKMQSILKMTVDELRIVC